MVYHFDPHPYGHAQHRHLHHAVRRGKLQRVGQQIGQHLDHAVAVNVHLQHPIWRPQPHRHTVLACETFVGDQRLLDQQPDVDNLQIQAHLAGLDFFDIQDVVDQPDQALAVVLGNADQVLSGLRQRTGDTPSNQSQ